MNLLKAKPYSIYGVLHGEDSSSFFLRLISEPGPVFNTASIRSAGSDHSGCVSLTEGEVQSWRQGAQVLMKKTASFYDHKAEDKICFGAQLHLTSDFHPANVCALGESGLNGERKRGDEGGTEAWGKRERQ